MLVRCGTLTERELAMVLEIQARRLAVAALRATRVRRWGRSSSNRDWYSRRWSKLHWKNSSSNARPKPSSSNPVRVDADKLDHLINLIGELVIAGAGAISCCKRSRTRN